MLEVFFCSLVRKEDLDLSTAVLTVGAGDRGKYRVRTAADCSNAVLHKSLATPNNAVYAAPKPKPTLNCRLGGYLDQAGLVTNDFRKFE